MTSPRGIFAPGHVAGSTGLAACSASQQTELEIGRRHAEKINRQQPIVEDPLTHRYIDRLGERGQSFPGAREIPYTFKPRVSELPPPPPEFRAR